MYDATNLRVKKTAVFGLGSTSTVYVFNGTSLIAEYVAGAAATSPSKEYIGGGGSALASVSAGVVTYYHGDHLSTRAQSDGAGAVTRTSGHYPYGEDWYATGNGDKWKFTTYERDSESNLNYAMNRYHSGQYGRFMTLDPLAGSTAAPQSLNRYAYAGNDPVNHVDPTGMFCELTAEDPNPPCAMDGGGGPSNPDYCPPSISDCNGGGDPGYGPTYLVDGREVPESIGHSVLNSGIGGEVVGGELELGIKFGPNGDGAERYDILVLFVTQGGPLGGGPAGGGGARSVVKILSTKNRCSDWLNAAVDTFTGGISSSALNAFQGIQIANQNMPGNVAARTAGSSLSTPIYLNPFGAFFGNGRGMIGDVYPAGSTPGQMVILLHEFAHKVNAIPSDGPPLLGLGPSGGGNIGLSVANTRLILINCMSAINGD